MLAGCGVAVIGIGLFFLILRPALLPEDRRYMAVPEAALDAVLPGLSRWLQKVFLVMGGYILATGILTVHLALADVREGSTTALVVAAFAGASFVGLVAVINIALRSDFRTPLLGLAGLWTAGTVLAASGI